MKFIWAFLECLIGLTLFLVCLWAEFIAPVLVVGTVIEDSRFTLFFFLALLFLWLQAVGVWLIIDAVKRGNRK